MIEKVVLKFLNENMSVPAYMEEPEEQPERYLLIEKTSGGKRDGLQTATLAIQSYAPTLDQAAELNEEVKNVMEEIENQNPVSRAALNTDYNYTDTATKRYRYQAVYDFIYY